MPARKKPASVEWIPAHWMCLGALAVLTVITYADSLHGKFVFDDLSVILQNAALMNVKTLRDATAPVLGGGWRQLLFATYALNYYWSGLDTFSYHLVNVALHVMNVWVVYGILLAAFREDEKSSRYIAFWGAAVFGVHTFLSGAVSYIAGRSSVLCGTFYFAAIYLFFKALKTHSPEARYGFFGLTAVSAFLAWGAKQEAITLPLFLAAVILLRAKKIDWRWIAALAAVPLVAVIVMFGSIKTLYTEIQANSVLVSAGFSKVMPATTYVRTYVTTVVDYFLPRFVFPHDLSVDPEIATVEHWYSPEFLFALAVIASLVWGALRLYRTYPLLSLGITAILVSPLMAYAVIPLPDVVQEHRAYIPGLGIAFLSAGLIQWLRQKHRVFAWPVALAIVLSLAAMTTSRNTVFANNVALWEDAVAKSPEKARPHFNLGQAYQEAQRIPDAQREYERSLQLKPDIYAAYSNLAAIYLDQGQLEKGEEMLLKVTSLSPTFTEGFINLAVFYIRKHDPDKALVAIDQALKTNPDSFAAHYNKGEILTMKGQYKEAVKSYEASIHLRPDMYAFKLTLGTAYTRAGDLVSAERQFNELTNTPVAADAYRNLGLLYQNAGKPDQAMQYFQQAVQVRPVFPEAYHDMGVAYLRKQMADPAIEQFHKVLQQQPDHGPAILNLAAAYQLKGDIPAARQTLEGYVQRYGSSNAPYLPQVRERLLSLK